MGGVSGEAVEGGDCGDVSGGLGGEGGEGRVCSEGGAGVKVVTVMDEATAAAVREEVCGSEGGGGEGGGGEGGEGVAFADRVNGRKCGEGVEAIERGEGGEVLTVIGEAAAAAAER